MLPVVGALFSTSVQTLKLGFIVEPLRFWWDEAEPGISK
jgi:hypothetical protein